MKVKGRNLTPRVQGLRQSNLPCRLLDGSRLLLVTLLPAFAFLLSACVGDPAKKEEVLPIDKPIENINEEPSSAIDSIKTKVAIYLGGDLACESIASLDYFIYSYDGTQALEQHKRIDAVDLLNEGMKVWLSMELSTPSKSPRIVVFIANCPKAFNISALQRKDSMDKLEYLFVDENPSLPLLSGQAELKPGEDCIVKLLPLLCRYRLASVTNGLPGYELLEDPSVRLYDISRSARILEFENFRPSEFLREGPLFRLPYDVGFYSQKPNIELWCYPNNTPETVLGVSRSGIEFLCRIKGQNCSFSLDLPPITRGQNIDLELVINDVDDYYLKSISKP